MIVSLINPFSATHLFQSTNVKHIYFSVVYIKCFSIFLVKHVRGFNILLHQYVYTQIDHTYYLDFFEMSRARYSMKMVVHIARKHQAKCERKQAKQSKAKHSQSKAEAQIEKCVRVC